jgi:ATP-dependent Clp protease ATP-binding subunit ClpA
MIMFERFTRTARDAVIQAQTEAAELGDDRIGTEHVLLGVLWNADGVCKQVLDASGIGYRGIRDQVASGPGSGPLDPDALAGIGIDIEEVRRRAEESFGPGALNRRPGGCRTGHIPFTPDSKKTLELALREAIALQHKEIRPEHILLGLTRQPKSSAGLLITTAGVRPSDLGDQLRSRLRRAA